MLRFNIQGSSGGACSNLLILFIQEMPLKNGSSPESSPFLGTLVVRVYVFNHVECSYICNLRHFLRKVSSENSRLGSTWEKSNACS